MRRRVLALALVCAALAAVAPRAVLGAGVPNMHISVPGVVGFAQEAPVTVTLKDGNTPLPNEVIHLSVNGRHRADLRTDGRGVAQYRFPRTSVPGTYRIVASFDGDASRQVSPAQVSATLIIARPRSTTVALDVPPPTKTGQQLRINVTLTSVSGSLAGQTVRVTVGSIRALDLIIKDPAGATHLTLDRNTPAGTYTVTATYHGNRRLSLSPASATQTLTVLPLSLTVQTLPALTGAPITFDGVTATTDATGVAQFTVPAAGNHQLSAATPPDTATTKAAFARWSDGQIVTSRQLHLVGDAQVLAGYRTSILTTLKLSDARGRAIDPARVGTISIAAPDGATQVLRAPYTPLWLTFPAPSRAALTLRTPTARFSLVSATYDGVVVANRGDDPLLPRPGATWDVRLRIYTLHIATRHPLIPGAGPHAVRVIPEHGTPLIVALDDQGQATIDNLPRDQYTVTVPASAYAPVTPVALSRDQTVSMVVVGAQDLLVVGVAAFLILALLIVVARRPQWLPRIRR